MFLYASRSSCCRRVCAVRMAISCGATWMAARHCMCPCACCAAVAFRRSCVKWRTRSCWTEGGGGVRCGAAGAHDGCVWWEGPTIPRPVLEGRVLK
ncbi:hypothetical protein, conserved [Trypanosoma cruzi]|uniref:Uncharacterized protein n=1 Tax=Trypanosoma cruzi (strain CL Brener) TaxID=353153 RepID=Q4CKP2_TRYCC|nr:hypothetical protein, conserved [Trypanosoma cruzi]EAN80845.1 hypothetical protein, conserved [Trypanosoma cruzi]|eukprot:XP_802291.1 hypothetical protein [Trypanosoma cruzi strain CL Brener]